MTTTQVPVAGGQLTAETYRGCSEPILAVHGISSHRRLWNWLRAEAPDLTLIAPDLRGRGDSIGVEGPSSIERHAEDMIAVLDAHGVDRVHVLGMSMGGFIGVALAHRHPDRVKSLVLVDGGFPMAAPPGLTRDLVPAAFADRLRRLEQRWPSLDGYLEFFVANTAPLLDPADPLLRDYLAHDLDADGQVRLSGEALVADAEDVFFGDNPSESLTVPIRLLHAEWSIGRDSAPAYSAGAVADLAKCCVSTRFLPGADHAGSIMTKPGAVATAELISEALR